MKKTCLTTVVLLLLTVLPAGNILAKTELPGIPLLLLNKIYVPDGAVLSAGRQVWMDRNLGAIRVATSSTDAAAYGDLYQWGRLTDGHEKRDSAEVETRSDKDVPGHSKFITLNETPFDWRSPDNTNLWQGINGINNPCPAGFRIPTEAEWSIERDSWEHQNAAGAFASPLKLVVGGYRYFFPAPTNPNINKAGTHGYYWSSTVGSGDSRYLVIHSSGAIIYGNSRALGYSVRCIMD